MFQHLETSCFRRSARGPIHLLLITMGAAAALACSGPVDSGDDVTPPASLSGEEREAEFRLLQEAPLSEEEMTSARERLSELGVDVREVAFAGRLVGVGDAYLDVDAVLGSAPDANGDIEKGRTFAAIDNRQEIDSLPLAPVIYSQIFNGNYQWMRPDISNNVSIVIPNAAAASFLISVFQQAVTNIVNAANDCLKPNTTFIVRTQAQYDALTFDEKNLTKPIFVRYGSLSTVCPLGGATTNGCSLFPRKETRDFGGIFQTRLVPGTRIGIVSSRVTNAHPDKLGIVTHELLHTLGIAHPFEANAVTVIGTSGSGFTTSVMQGYCPPGPSCLFVDTPSADDIDTIDTLYSQQSSALYPGGDSCQWRDGVKTIAAN